MNRVVSGEAGESAREALSGHLDSITEMLANSGFTEPRVGVTEGTGPSGLITVLAQSPDTPETWTWNCTVRK